MYCLSVSIGRMIIINHICIKKLISIECILKKISKILKNKIVKFRYFKYLKLN